MTFLNAPPTGATQPALSARSWAWRLAQPVDGTGMAVFRIVFGLVLAVGQVRLLLSGWLPKLYEQPTFFFKFWGFSWVEPLPMNGMVALHVLLAACALGVALGAFHRACAWVFLIGFSYTQLIDVTNYLNHYVLVMALMTLCAFTPVHRTWSIDAWRRPSAADGTVPAWAVWIFRFQVGLVYVHAGLAKLHPDWLLLGEPLHTWLAARAHTPVIGPWLHLSWVALAASWCGFLYDTTIVAWLSWRKTRALAFLGVLAFHGMTHVWFQIGLFPFLMTTGALVFFAPDWPRRRWEWVQRSLGGGRQKGRITANRVMRARPAVSRAAAWTVGALCVVWALLPLRHLAYPGDVLWNEEGMRFAWKVMLREKHGSVTFKVRFTDSGKELMVTPREHLTAKQEREMGSQPDLILQLAQHIGVEQSQRGLGPVEVRAEALVSLNGRRPQFLIDPTHDLSRARDGLGAKDWILPGPTDTPRTGKLAAR